MGTKITFLIPDVTGDTRQKFDASSDEGLAKAEERFKELTGNLGFRAASLGAVGEPGKILKDFDKTSEKVLFFKPLKGG